MYYDLTQQLLILKHFLREGYKKPGYSKDGKFKEDQIVIGMATDENGIPLHYKIFPGNVTDSNTFIPFMLEIADIYEVNSVTTNCWQRNEC